MTTINVTADRLVQQPKHPHETDASAKMIQEAMEFSPQWQKSPNGLRYAAPTTIAQREHAMFANGFDFAAVPLEDNKPPKQYRLDKIVADPSDGSRFTFGGKTYILKSPEKPYSQTLVDDPDSPGRKVLRVEVRSGDYWSKGDAYADPDKNRAEISTGIFDQIGGTYDYSFGIKLPTDFPQEKQEPKRMVLAQWWQRDKESPPLSLRYKDGKLQFVLKLPNGEKKTLPWDADFNPEDAKKLGVWDNFRVQVKWSPNGDGSIDIYLDGKHILGYKGATCAPGPRGPVFKAGIYRDNTPRTAVAYYRDIERKREDQPE